MIVNCDKCGRPVNDRTETVWNAVKGWEKKRDGGGTNHIALRTPESVYCCNACMHLMLAGIPTGQESLL